VVKISIIGAGPGSPDYVTPISRKTVNDADVVIGAERALSLFVSDIKGETVKLTAKNMNETLNKAVELAKNGKTVAILSTGDPGFSGLLRTFSKDPNREEVEVNVIPGISSIQMCAARLRFGWDEAQFFSFHEGADVEQKEELVRVVKKGKIVILLPDSKDFRPQEISRFLLERGVNAKTPVFVCENLTLNNEKVLSSTLDEVKSYSSSPLCVMVIKPYS